MSMPDLSEIRKSFADTYARLFAPFTIFVFLACWIVAVMAGPFGTYSAMELPLRAVYWFGIVVGAIIVGFAVRAVTVVLVQQDRPFRADMIASLAMTVVFAPCVIAMRYLASLAAEGIEVNVVEITFNTFILSAAVFVLRRQVSPEEPGVYLVSEPEPEPAAEDVATPRLWRRLPAEMQGEVLRISANNHHVDVVTIRGTTALRMRLVDAIDEMEPVEGYCTHRSHWVARAAITGIERSGADKLFVLLTNGEKIPISRKYRPGLEEAGIVAVK